MTAKQFILNVSVQYISRIFAKLQELVFIFVIIKKLNAVSYGIYSQIITTSLLLVPLFLMGLRESSVRYLAGQEDIVKKSRGFFSMLWAIWFLFILVFIVANSYKEPLSMLIFNSKDLSYYVLLLLLLVFSQANLRFILNYYRSINEVLKYSIIEIILSVVEVAFLAYVVLFSQPQLPGIIFILIFLEGGFALLALFDIVRRIGLSFIHIKTLLPFLIFSLPMLLTDILSWIVDASDKYIIVHFLDLGNLGIYSASYKIGQIAIFSITPIAFVLFPLITKFWEEAKFAKVNKFIDGSLKLYIIVALPIVIGIYQLSPYILNIIATSEFVINKGIVLMILLGFFFLGLSKIYQLTIYLKEKTKYFIPIYVVAAIINLSLNFLLIPKMGIAGAAVSTLLSYFLIFIIIYFISQKMIPLKFNMFFFWKVLCASMVMFVSLSFFRPSDLAHLVLVSLLGICVYVFFIFILRAMSKEELNLAKDILSVRRSSNLV